MANTNAVMLEFEDSFAGDGGKLPTMKIPASLVTSMLCLVRIGGDSGADVVEAWPGPDYTSKDKIPSARCGN